MDTATAETQHPEYERMHAELAEHGYRDIPEHNGIKVGARVRHIGHRYPEAYREGTGTVLAVMHKDPSSWSASYGRPDIELLVAQDRPMSPGFPISGVADYHVEVIEVGDK